MPILQIICGNCQTAINVDAQYAGRTGKCPKCNKPFVVPSASASKPPSDDLQGIAAAAQPPPKAAKNKTAYVSQLAVELNAKEKRDYTAPIAIGIFSGVITAVVVSLLISSNAPKYGAPTTAIPPVASAAQPSHTTPPPLVSTPDPTPTDTPLHTAVVGKPIEASDLSAAYVDNTISADARYKDKSLEVRGVVEDVENKTSLRAELDQGDRTSYPCVVLIGPFPRRVVCFFDRSVDALPSLADIHSGDTVVIHGTCRGVADFALAYVELHGCSLVRK